MTAGKPVRYNKGPVDSTPRTARKSKLRSGEYAGWDGAIRPK